MDQKLKSNQKDWYVMVLDFAMLPLPVERVKPNAFLFFLFFYFITRENNDVINKHNNTHTHTHLDE
jgi:hypothetical protein